MALCKQKMISFGMLSFWSERIFALLLFACFLFFLFCPVLTESFDSKQIINSTQLRPIGPILNGDTISQQFECSGRLKALAVNMATYARTNRGGVRFLIKDIATNKVLYQEELRMEALLDNRYHTFVLPKAQWFPERKYLFAFEGMPDCTPANAVTCWASNAGKLPLVEKNGKSLGMTIQYKVYILEHSILWLSVFGLGSLLMLILKDSFLLNAVRKPENIFLIIGTLSALSILYFSPVLQQPDSEAHLFRIYQISEGKLFYRPNNIKVSENEKFWIDRLVRNQRVSFYGKTLQSEKGKLLEIPFDCGAVNRKHRIMGYAPIAYFHTAIASFVARKASFSFFNGIILLTIIATLFYLSVVYAAIRISPCFKWPLLFVALSPMAFYQGVSYSADSFIISVSMLFFALVMRMREAGTNSCYLSRNLFLLGLLAVCIGLCKFVYFPLLFLLFLLPKKNFKSGSHYWIYTLSVIFTSAFLGWLWNKLATDPTTMVQIYRADLGTTGKMKFIITQPISFIKYWLETQPQLFGIVIKRTIGVLGYLTVYFPAWFYPAYLIVLITIFFMIREKNNNWKIRCFFFFFFLFTVALIYVAIYCINSIQSGIQGRYLIHLLPLLFLVFGQKKFGLPGKILPYYKGLLVIGIIAMQILISETLYHAYWI